jgi:CBS domain containing-hemolysin-like protein
VTADILGWFAHPVTLTLAGVLVVLLFAVVEVLLRSLAEIGNVRFQGILEDHERLLPVGGDATLHLSRLLDVLRWVEIASVGLLWLIVLTLPGVGRAAAIAMCVLLPPALVVMTRLVIGALGEDSIAALMRVLRPLVWPSVLVLARREPKPQAPPPDEEDEEASDREIKAYLEAGEAAGIFERHEGEFVESLVDFFDTVVREVMTPRTDMVAVPEGASLTEALETIAATHKSRVPVYQETVDRVVGVVHVKTLVKHFMADEHPPLSELVQDCLVVPESKPLGELLRDFQQEHQQMAIVVDEYGGTSGLVTLEDVLEEIVGDIQDEHEPRQPPECQELAPGVYRLQGKASLEVLEQLYGVQIPEGEVDTVGGLVFWRHGTVPEAGTEVIDPTLGLQFTVEEMQERRVVSVTVQRMEIAADSPTDAQP